jgi:hypothetical protein
MVHSRLYGSVALLALALAAPAAPAANVEWTRFVDEYIEAHFVAQPATAVTKGRHEFDGQLPDWTAAGIQKEIARLEQARVRALTFQDGTLSRAERFQRDYVVTYIDSNLFYTRDARMPFTNPQWYFWFGLDPGPYVSVPYAPAEQRLRAFVKYLKQIPAMALTIRTNLQTPLPPTFLTFAEKSFGGFAPFFRNDAPQAFAEVQDAQLKSELNAAIEPAAQAMQDLSEWFRDRKPGGNEAYVLGPELFARMLRMNELVTTPLDKLEAIGRADLERNLAALKDECARYAPKASIEACIAKVSADKAPGGAVAGARQQLAQLRQHVVDHDVVSIPGEEEALVMEAPAYRRQNFAYINIPGPYEKNVPSVYRIAPPDPTWPKAEQDAYTPGQADLLFTSVHEVWPGHFLQFLHSNRNPSRIGSLWVGYAFAEGWAHYTEELMWEEGLGNGDPEMHVGQLISALLRDARFLSAIGLHAQGMTLEESEKLFRESAFADVGTARQQSTRGTYDPGYLNYTLGKLLIRKLRADWTAKQSGGAGPDEARKHWRAFHDKFLSYGGPPVPLVRKEMLGDAAGAL